MDIEMPNMNGIEAIKKINSEGKNARTLVVSNHNEKDLIMEASKKGAKYYIYSNLYLRILLKKGLDILFSSRYYPFQKVLI